MTVQTAEPVRASVVVEAPIDQAFTTFTRDIGRWWPPDHHLLEAPLKETVFEPRVGGGILDRGEDGSECRWATVLAYEPPERVCFSWSITVDWQVERDPERASEVEVRFIAEGPQRTRVELEHRKLERHGVGWESMRDAVGSERGWQLILDAFGSAAGAPPG